MYSHLRKIIAHSDTSIEKGALECFVESDLIPFCKRNRQITVIVRFSCTCANSWAWLGMHYAVCRMLRGSKVETPDQFRPWLVSLEWLRSLIYVEHKFVPANYRLTLTNRFEPRRQDIGGGGVSRIVQHLNADGEKFHFIGNVMLAKPEAPRSTVVSTSGPALYKETGCIFTKSTTFLPVSNASMRAPKHRLKSFASHCTQVSSKT
jgi:hypothetical protein